jgi:phospholipid-binding lipoprotein MlaA
MRAMSRRLLLLPFVLLLVGCAALPPGKRDARDPFERMNRGVYRFNTETDKLVLRPAALAWRSAVPVPVRRSLGNFLGNLGYTSTIINDLLQGELRDAATATMRFSLNTVLGLGFFDPAARLGMGRRDQNFSDTLSRWGVPAGPYLMLPLAGPSSVRDAPALFINDYMGVRHYLNENTVRIGLSAIGVLELRTQLLSTDAVVRNSYDPYALTRNAWLQRREFLHHDRTPLDGEAGGQAMPADDNSPPLEEPPDAPGDEPAVQPATSPEAKPGPLAEPRSQQQQQPAPPAALPGR